jgi:hypothetical protein
MTPAALAILQICAAHVVWDNPGYPGAWGCSTILTSGSMTLGSGSFHYAAGFEQCDSLVPPLKAQKDAEDKAAAEKKYVEENAADIEALKKAAAKLDAESRK